MKQFQLQFANLLLLLLFAKGKLQKQLETPISL
jgi:hypothetical protein